MNRKKNNRESGQSTVEFALTLILLIGFSMFYLRLALVFAFGNYAHYATFMAARAYLSAGAGDRDEQKQRAEDVIVSMLKRGPNQAGADRFPFIAKAEKTEGNVPGMEFDIAGYKKGVDRTLSWGQGVRYKFKSRLLLMSFSGSASSRSDVNLLNLTSESWLGREPSFDDCKTEMGNRVGIFDNGC